MSGQYDVIIIGSGPNRLAIGAYLSKAGQKVLLLEKRYEAGGGLAPEGFYEKHVFAKIIGATEVEKEEESQKSTI